MRAIPTLSLGFLCVLLVAVSACDKEKGLRITNIEPKAGSPAGGTQVVLSGSGFQAEGALGVRVLFGGRQARVHGFDGDTRLVVEAPAGEEGETVDVKLLFDDAREFTYPQAFTYVDLGKGFGVDELVGPDDD
jgi:hypothetical protein